MFNKITDFFNKFLEQFQPILDILKSKNPEKNLPRNFEKERQYISGLLFDVLLNKKIVREALLKFPDNLQDETSITAYHALIHYESDEELRQKDKMYADEQNDYILYIAETLQKGEKLPKNIINGYKKFYRWAPSKYSDSKENLITKLKRYINI